MDGFKHEDDWQRHPYGCDCDKCYKRVTENAEKMILELKEMKWGAK